MYYTNAYNGIPIIGRKGVVPLDIHKIEVKGKVTEEKLHKAYTLASLQYPPGKTPLMCFVVCPSQVDAFSKVVFKSCDVQYEKTYGISHGLY